MGITIAVTLGGIAYVVMASVIGHILGRMLSQKR